MIPENSDLNNSFELDISWEDISNDNYIISSMKRNGVYGYATEEYIILSDGSPYRPEILSDHWEAYNNSKKFRPKIIKYLKV